MTGLDVRWALQLPASGTLLACNCWGGDGELVHDGVMYAPETLTGPAVLREAFGEKAEAIGIRVGSTPALKTRLLMDRGRRPDRKFVKLLMLWRATGSTDSWAEARRYEGLISRVEVAGMELAVEIDQEVPKSAAQEPAVWSDRTQRAFNDRFFEHLGALAKGVSVVWPS